MQGSIRGILLDIDGVLEYQGEICPGALEAIERLRTENYSIRFLTNSTLKSRRSCAEQLVRAGFQAAPEDVITASYATARYLHQINPLSCWVMLAREGQEEFAEIPQDEDDPEYIIVGDYRENFHYKNLNKALNLLSQGAGLIAMQGELADHSSGKLELNVGSWAGMLERASGVQAVYIGKPRPYIFDVTLSSMGLAKHEILMVGDKVDTDIRGAKEYGLRTALVMTGEFKKGDLNGNAKPDFVLESLLDVVSLVTSQPSSLQP